MVLSAIYSFIKKVFTLLIKGIAWLLVALSLWVPLLFALVFLVVCGAANIDFGSVTTYFYAGLIVSFLVSFFISNSIYERKRRNKKAKANAGASSEKVKDKEIRAEIKKKKDDENPKEPQSEKALKGENENYPAPAGYPSAEENFNAGKPLQNNTPVYGYGAPPLSVKQTQNSFFSEEQRFGRGEREDSFMPASEKLGFSYGERENSIPSYMPYDMFKGYEDIRLNSEIRRQDSKAETPKIFATRKDPTVFVYEFSDRVEIYKRTRQGMVFMERRFKY